MSPQWKVGEGGFKGTICIQVEYDRTSYIVLKNFWLVYNFLWSGGGHHLCLTDTLHFLKITPNKKQTTLSIIIKYGGAYFFSSLKLNSLQYFWCWFNFTTWLVCTVNRNLGQAFSLQNIHNSSYNGLGTPSASFYIQK